jgi:uncharacterized membrane protein YtjA (UPF0391 family)
MGSHPEPFKLQSVHQIQAPKGKNMLTWSLLFLVIAVVSAIFGFGGIAAASAGVAQLLFVLFSLLFAGTLLWQLVTRK